MATDSGSAAGLPLPDFRASNFRCFSELELPKLGRVNLIVGKNNVGKTTLLEAIRIYASLGSPREIANILREWHDDRPIVAVEAGELTSASYPLLRIFFGRSSFRSLAGSIELGPADARITITPRWKRDGVDDYAPPETAVNSSEKWAPGIDIQSVRRVFVPLAKPFGSYSDFYFDEQLTKIPLQLISAKGIDPLSLSQFWDRIALSESEDRVYECLKTFRPRIARLSLVGEGGGPSRLPMARIEKSTSPIPVASLGAGVERALGITLALVNAENGILLIDEFEQGLHYTTLLDVWRFLIPVATELNVQVFATTHSNDCVDAFSIAASESNEEGVLIRLQERGGKIEAVTLDEEQTERAREAEIEVR